MKTILFNGKNILFLREKGVYWISVKSVCEALNVNYNRQFQQIKQDEILKAAFANKQMQVPGDQKRNLLCLPEQYVYGWIFSIDSKSEELLAYKKECYDVLFNHFHGVITRRAELYSEIATEKKKIKSLEDTLAQNKDYMELISARMREARLWKNIKNTGNDMAEIFDED